MNGLTCPEVEAQIELFASGECDPPDAAAVEHHLASCPECAQALAEARWLVGALDAGYQQEDRLGRLHARLAEDEARTVRTRRFTLLVRGTAALAAVVLIALALFALRTRPGPELVSGPELSVQLAFVQLPPMVLPLRSNPPSRGKPEELPAPAPAGKDDKSVTPDSKEIERGKPEELPAPAPAGKDDKPVTPDSKEIEHVKHIKPEEGVSITLPRGRTGEQSRQDLQAAAAKGRPRPPARVPVSLEVRNTGSAPLELWTGGPPAQIAFDLTGPGVLRVVAPDTMKGLVDSPRLRTLAPGQTFTLPIPSLIEERDGVRSLLYLTEPGEYSLTIRFTTAVYPAPPGSPRIHLPADPQREFGRVTFTSEPLRVKAVPFPSKQ